MSRERHGISKHQQLDCFFQQIVNGNNKENNSSAYFAFREGNKEI